VAVRRDPGGGAACHGRTSSACAGSLGSSGIMGGYEDVPWLRGGCCGCNAPAPCMGRNAPAPWWGHGPPAGGRMAAPGGCSRCEGCYCDAPALMASQTPWTEVGNAKPGANAQTAPRGVMARCSPKLWWPRRRAGCPHQRSDLVSLSCRARATPRTQGNTLPVLQIISKGSPGARLPPLTAARSAPSCGQARRAAQQQQS
jgi:hypothetical protein